MALYTIPVAARVAHQDQITTLDGRPYRLAFRYNGRLRRWFFSIETASETPIAQGKALVSGVDLLRQQRHNPDAPQGVLLVVDTEGGRTDPDFNSLGARHRVLYFTED